MKIFSADPDLRDNLDIYKKYWLPFGEILTDMERTGFKIDVDHLEKVERLAKEDMNFHRTKFIEWVCKQQKDESCQEFNPKSTQQMQQLLFAPFYKNNVKSESFFRNEVEKFKVENKTGFIKEGKKRALKYRDMEIRGLGLKPISWTKTLVPMADANVIRQLAGKDP